MRTKCAVIVRDGDDIPATKEMLKKALMRELRNHPGAEREFETNVSYTVSRLDGISDRSLVKITAELKRKERRSEGRGC